MTGYVSRECRGCQVIHGRQGITLFSASHYCGKGNNDGCVLMLPHGFKPADITASTSGLRHTYGVRSHFAHMKMVPRRLLPRGMDFSSWVKACIAVEALVTNKLVAWHRLRELDDDGCGQVRAACAQRACSAVPCVRVLCGSPATVRA